MEGNYDPNRNIQQLEALNQDLQERLFEVQETLRAITTGEVDALVVYDEQSERIYTLQGSDYAYRVMVENLHEGTAYIRPDGVILYGNKHLAKMLGLPLERVLSANFHHYIAPNEHQLFDDLIRDALKSSGRAELRLVSTVGQPLPVLINASMAEVDGRRGVCLAVTDLTEQKLAAAREKELQKHLTEQREQERLRIARNLHDGPLQDLIGLSFSMESLISKGADPDTTASLQDLRGIALKLAADLRAVTNELRPPSAIRFGLAKAIRYLSEDFQAKSPDLKIHLDLPDYNQAIPADLTTAIFRVVQEAMNNIQRHARATDVRVRLLVEPNAIILEVQDNGVGFRAPDDWNILARNGHLGLVGMWERVEGVGGKIQVRSALNHGTTIHVDIPCQLQTASES